MCALQFLELRDDQLERLIPGRALERAVALNQWMQQTVWMMYLQVGRHALRAEAAFVDGKIIARLEADDVVVLDQKIHAALHRAVGAMCGHDAVYDAVCAPA